MRAVRQYQPLFSILLVFAVLAACNNNNSGDAAEKDSKETANVVKGETAGATAAAAEPLPVIADDLYPDFPFAQFNPEEKAKIVKLTKAELCPCPESSQSMHECMQDRDKRCDLANQAMNMIGGMVKASYNETDILDQVAEFLDAAKRQHSFQIDDRPLKGNRNASVILVEFADFECPHCKEASKIMKSISESYGPKIGLVYKHYPLPSHEFSELAARAAVAAHKQGKFWPMHDELFKNQKSLGYAQIVNMAQRIGLNMGKFKLDVESPDVREFVARDRKDGEDGGLTGTPTIFINGRRYLGDTTEDSIRAAIDKALRDAAKVDPDKTTTTTKTD